MKKIFADIEQSVEFGAYIQPDNYFVSYIFATDAQLKATQQSGLTEQINSYHREQMTKRHYPIQGIKDCCFAYKKNAIRNLTGIGITTTNNGVLKQSGGLAMNEKLFRPAFNRIETTEKQALMESLAARYDMTFLGLHTFDRWGQSSTTGIFEKDGREFVFVPGDTVTLGWERFAIGLSQDSREELDYLFQEWEMEQDPEEMIRESMAPVRQAAIGPMLVGRELEELCWEPVTMDDPRLTAHPDWLKQFREFAWSDLDSLTMHQSARIERTEKGFQICIYNRTDYDELLAGLEKQGLSLPTADEWAYLCGGGCRTLFPWGDGMDYSMHLHHFESPEDEDKPFDMEEPNFFGVSIAYDPYMREVVKAGQFTTCGGDGGRSICGGLGIFLGFLPCSPHCKPEVQEDKELNGDYDFYRPTRWFGRALEWHSRGQRFDPAYLHHKRRKPKTVGFI